MKTSSLPILAILLASAEVACSSAAPSVQPIVADAGAPGDAALPTSDSDAGGSGGTGDAAVTLDAAPSCNEIAASAPSVPYSLSSSASPAAATGGAIADGTYYLTAYTVFGAGSVGAGFIANQATSLTLEISAGTWSQAQVFTIEGTTSAVRSNLDVTTSGTSITLTPSCPGGAATTGSYTATSTAIQFVSQTSGFVVSETFAKQ